MTANIRWPVTSCCETAINFAHYNQLLFFFTKRMSITTHKSMEKGMHILKILTQRFGIIISSYDILAVLMYFRGSSTHLSGYFLVQCALQGHLNCPTSVPFLNTHS